MGVIRAAVGDCEGFSLCYTLHIPQVIAVNNEGSMMPLHH